MSPGFRLRQSYHHASQLAVISPQPSEMLLYPNHAPNPHFPPPSSSHHPNASRHHHKRHGQHYSPHEPRYVAPHGNIEEHEQCLHRLPLPNLDGAYDPLAMLPNAGRTDAGTKRTGRSGGSLPLLAEKDGAERTDGSADTFGFDWPMHRPSSQGTPSPSSTVSVGAVRKTSVSSGGSATFTRRCEGGSSEGKRDDEAGGDGMTRCKTTGPGTEWLDFLSGIPPSA